MNICKLHRGVRRALTRISGAPSRRNLRILVRAEPGKLPSPPVDGGWKIPSAQTANLQSNASTDWQRRLLLKRGAQIYKASTERTDRCAIAILDASGVVIAWHDYLPHARPYDHRVVSRHMSQFYLPQDVALHLPSRHLAIASAQGANTQRGWRCRPSGEVFWGVTVIQTILLKDGELLGYSHVTRLLRAPVINVSSSAARMTSPLVAGCAMA